MARDLSVFEDKLPDRGDGEDEVLTVIQLRRPNGVDGPIDPEFIAKFDELVALAESLYGPGSVTVASQSTTVDAVVSEVSVNTGGGA